MFLLSVYNGPVGRRDRRAGAAAVRGDAAVVRMFWIHVLGNAPRRTAVGWIADRSNVAVGLQSAVAAMGIAGVLFMIVARRQGRETVA